MTTSAEPQRRPRTIRVAITGSPIGKGRPRFSRATARAFTPEKTRKYEAVLRLAAQETMGGNPPLEGPVLMTATATFTPPKSWSKTKRSAALAGELYPTKKPDADNILKALGDALNEVVFLDDKQIVVATISKRFGTVAQLEVEVREIA